ncbi:MAG: MarR family transcriptional regulator [Candidatus Aenigmarchaeota archaeon]|nr:MarR family transcriptional regulator [Candidatus Aenigmarchaeota archaeon]
MRSAFVALFLVFAFTAQNALALEISEYNITFDILMNGYVNEEVSMVFTEELNASTLNYVVLGDISDLKILSDGKNIDYVLEKSGSEHDVKFIVPEGTETLQINFIAKDLVFAKDNIYSFFTTLQPPASENVNVIAFLPAGFAIYRDVVYPGGYETLTDGERIYIKWSFSNPEDIPLSFKFYSIYSDYSLAILIIMGLVVIVIAGYLIMHYRGKVKKEFLRGFSEDERRVLKALSERGVCMQKKLEKEFGFSRAKMTRVVKNLESKGLVEKERVGRTNRLFFKK